MTTPLMKTRRIALILFMLSTAMIAATQASAVEESQIKEETYLASEIDSQKSAKEHAINKMRLRVLDENGGVYVEKAIREEKNETDQGITSMTSEEKTNIASGIIKIDIINSTWDGHSCWIRATVKYDPAEIRENLQRIAAERRATRDKQQEIDSLKQQQLQQSQLVEQQLKLLDEKTRQMELENQRKSDELTKMIAELSTRNNKPEIITVSTKGTSKPVTRSTSIRKPDKTEINQLISEIQHLCASGETEERILSQLRSSVNIR